MPKYDKTLEEKMSGDMLDYLGYKEGKNPDDQPIHKDVKESLELLEHYYDEREKWALKFQILPIFMYVTVKKDLTIWIPTFRRPGKLRELIGNLYDLNFSLNKTLSILI